MSRHITVAGRTAGTSDPRWNLVVNRDASADGSFYYSVKSTGVYCRPSCGARLARPENVQFHMTCAEAEQAGFRPCKRCKPNQPAAVLSKAAKKVESACRMIERSENLPSLDEVARHAGLSAYHFHRTFKSFTGLTPKEYARAHRCHRILASLKTNNTVTQAMYDAGFDSSGRFYETSNQLLGMTPSTFRAGGRGMDVFFAIGECSLGSFLVAQTKKGVCSILLGDDPVKLARDLHDRFPNANLIANEPCYEALVAKVVSVIENPGLGVHLPLDIRGTAFQRRVWQALRRISPGSTVSYTEIARRIGMPKAVRAVARTCGANALAVAIPCHRVVRSDGSISGYRWGVERKRALLERESRARPVTGASSLPPALSKHPKRDQR